MNIAWSELKKVGQSKLVNMTILIPLFGYIIFFNDKLTSIVEISTSYLSQFQTIESNISFDTSNNLFYIYFGLSLLGIASILYKLASPSLINEYISMREYIDKERNIMNLCNTTSLYNLLTDQKNSKVSSLQDKIIPVEEIDIDTVVGIMSINWEHNNTLYKKTRVLILLLYIFGFFLISIPSIKMFFAIIIIFFYN